MSGAKNMLIFGAGKIGRSFIGQLFGRSGYEVIFVDIDQKIIDAINHRGSYRVVIKDKKEEEILIDNVRAVSGLNIPEVIREISGASMMSISVGKNALPKLMPTLAQGIAARFGEQKSAPPLDIIIAENMRAAAQYMHDELIKYLPEKFPLDEKIGLIETSIGKMVPIMTERDLKADPLVVFAEAYNELILDKKGFRNPIPKVQGLAPKGNIGAWVDRKAFIHNLGHATAAYYGNFRHPDRIFLWEVLADNQVLAFTQSVMQEAADTLLHLYPNEFTREALRLHIDDLLSRFQNKALGDTVFRVGHDLRRKLAVDDRFMGIITLAKRLKQPYSQILRAMSYGFYFRAKDESGSMYGDDVEFQKLFAENAEQILLKHCGLTDKHDRKFVLEFN